MARADLDSIAVTLVTDGKGILLADETVPTLTRRFDTPRTQSTELSRRTYRKMLFTTPGAAEFISGIIMQDETICQKSSDGLPLAQVVLDRGILPGIKVVIGAKPLAGSPGERYRGPRRASGWHGRDENFRAGQRAFYLRARANGAASGGRCNEEMDAASQSVEDPAHRRDWRDD